ncbi:uncharacterized protein LOC144374220 isoform X4 [Ictidomys tridecemlineatus]
MFDCTEEKRKMRRRNTKEGSESSTEDSLTGCSDKPGPSHSMPDEGGNQSDTKNIAREKEELCKDFQQSSKDEAISDTGTRENKTLFDNSGTECQKEDEDEDNLVQFISIKTPFFSATDSKSEKPGVFTVQYPPVCLPGCVTGPFSEAEAFKEIINTPTNQSVPMKEAKTLKSAKPYLPVTPEDGRKILGGTQIQQPKAFLEINDTPPNQSVWMKDAKILKSAEPHLDVTPKEGQDTLDGTEHQQSTTRICEICSPKCFDHFSLDALQMKKHIVEEMGPLSSPVSSSSKLKFSKPEDARKEGTPVSPVGSQRAPSLKPPTALRHSGESTDPEMKGARRKDVKTITPEPHFHVKAEEAGTTLGGSKMRKPKAFLEINDTPPNQSVWMKDAKILKSAEPHLDVTPKEGQDTLDGTEHQQSTTRICEICSPKCFDHFSLDALQMKKHIVEEMGPLSSPVSSSSKLKFSKPEDARKEGTPVSPVGMEIKNVLNEPFCRKCVCQAMGGGKVLGSEMDDPFHWTLHNWCSLTSSTTGGTAQVLGVQRTEELP